MDPGAEHRIESAATEPYGGNETGPAIEARAALSLEMRYAVDSWTYFQTEATGLATINSGLAPAFGWNF